MNSLKQPVTEPKAPISSVDTKKFGDPTKGNKVSGSDNVLCLFGRGLTKAELTLGLSDQSFDVLATA